MLKNITKLSMTDLTAASEKALNALDQCDKLIEYAGDIRSLEKQISSLRLNIEHARNKIIACNQEIDSVMQRKLNLGQKMVEFVQGKDWR